MPTFIDLFSGCGGFTLGMMRAGFKCLAAVDINRHAIETLRSNLQSISPTGIPPVGFALQADLNELTPSKLAAVIATTNVDVIVGGPPCQGFSTARQRDGSNHGIERLKEDPRRHLFRRFLEHVEFFQPKVFVIENVLGIRTAAGGRYFTAVQHESRMLGREKGLPGYVVHGQIENADDLGVPQKRRRQLIIGVRADTPGYFPSTLKPTRRATLGATLGDAICDLPPLQPGEKTTEYDLRRRDREFLGGTRDRLRRRYLRCVAEVRRAKSLSNHIARPHSERDLDDFRLLSEGESSATAMRRGVQFKFPYDKENFKDRYTRQHRNRPCSTIVAHLSKDGLMFIHPVQDRSLTPREAARVQSFPDWFVFPDARTPAFIMIGNAVPPLVAEAVGLSIRRFLHRADTVHVETGRNIPSIPLTRVDAAARLSVLLRCDRRRLRLLDNNTFIAGWHALLWLLPHLHPDNARDLGGETMESQDLARDLPCVGSGQRQVFLRSGWPVALNLVGTEAWRRFEAGTLSSKALYCAYAQSARLSADRN